MENQKQPVTDGLQSLIKTKYLIIMILTAILAIISSDYFHPTMRLIVYGVLGFIFLLTLGLHQNVRFQKINKKLRPFIVTRIAQVIATIGYLALITFFVLMSDFDEYPNSLTPTIVYSLLGLALVYQFFSIFRWAKKAKKDFPDRCEFC